MPNERNLAEFDPKMRSTEFSVLQQKLFCSVLAGGFRKMSEILITISIDDEILSLLNAKTFSISTLKRGILEELSNPEIEK